MKKDNAQVEAPQEDVKKNYAEEIKQTREIREKILLLIQACSEVSGFLSVKADSASRSGSILQGIAEEIEKAEKKKEIVLKQMVSIEGSLKTDKQSFERWKLEQTNEINALKSLANRDKKESAEILAEAKKKLVALEKEKDDFETRRKELESRHSKIAALVG